MNKKDSLIPLGETIRKHRLSRHLSQVELAKKCQLNKNYIGMLERGEVNPSYLTMIIIAKALNITIRIK